MNNKRIGFTTSLPVEVILAAGHIPVDLNNIFVSTDAQGLVHSAEMKGFPRTVCSWIKGNFASALKANLDEVIGIVQGDCSNTHSLLALISEEGMPVFRFSYPDDKNPKALDAEIAKLEAHFGVTRTATLAMKQRLDKIRAKLKILDEWTWNQRLVSGKENHIWQVNASDFQGDPDSFERELTEFMSLAQKRDPLPTRLRLAYLGVPPIFSNIYDTISELGGDVLFNEVQRQFAMPHLQTELIDQYLDFTYPYSIFDRLKDIKEQIKLRHLDAIISYTQSFCHMQLDNLILKKHLKLPFLTLEGDKPEELDSRTLLRLESFFEVHG